jgi:hypothetical protein
MNAKSARFVGCSSDYSTFAIATNNDWFSSQLRLIK